MINSRRLGRQREFMLSTVLDCRQSLSAFSPHGYEVIGSVAQPFVRQGSKDVNWFQTSYQKALINVR